MYTPQYYEGTLDLTVARVNFRLEKMGSFFYLKAFTNPQIQLTVRINSPANPPIIVTPYSGIICKFDSLYISHPAYLGETVNIFISEDFNRLRFFDMEPTDIPNITAMVSYNFVAVVAANEYHTHFPQNATGFLVKARGGPIWFCFQAGESATQYILLADGQSFFMDDIFVSVNEIYWQSPNAGTVIEIIFKTI